MTIRRCRTCTRPLHVFIAPFLMRPVLDPCTFTLCYHCDMATAAAYGPAGQWLGDVTAGPPRLLNAIASGNTE